MAPTADGTRRADRRRPGGAVVTDGLLSCCTSILGGQLGDDRTRQRFTETLAKHDHRLLPPVAFADEEVRPKEFSATMAPGEAPAAVSIAVLPFVNLAGNAAMTSATA